MYIIYFATSPVFVTYRHLMLRWCILLVGFPYSCESTLIISLSCTVGMVLYIACVHDCENIIDWLLITDSIVVLTTEMFKIRQIIWKLRIVIISGSANMKNVFSLIKLVVK